MTPRFTAGASRLLRNPPPLWLHVPQPAPDVVPDPTPVETPTPDEIPPEVIEPPQELPPVQEPNPQTPVRRS